MLVWLDYVKSVPAPVPQALRDLLTQLHRQRGLLGPVEVDVGVVAGDLGDRVQVGRTHGRIVRPEGGSGSAAHRQRIAQHVQPGRIRFRQLAGAQLLCSMAMR